MAHRSVCGSRPVQAPCCKATGRTEQGCGILSGPVVVQPPDGTDITVIVSVCNRRSGVQFRDSAVRAAWSGRKRRCLRFRRRIRQPSADRHVQIGAGLTEGNVGGITCNAGSCRPEKAQNRRAQCDFVLTRQSRFRMAIQNDRPVNTGASFLLTLNRSVRYWLLSFQGDRKRLELCKSFYFSHLQ